VVHGKSAEALLDQHAGGSSGTAEGGGGGSRNPPNANETKRLAARSRAWRPG
jgi:hypothetical protein